MSVEQLVENWYETSWGGGRSMLWIVVEDGVLGVVYFFFNDTATTEIYTLSLHDALPILKAEA